MKKKSLLPLVASALLLAACGGGKVVYSSVDPLAGDKIGDFSEGKPDDIFASDGWSNGANFNCVWKEENVTFSDSKMHLAIKNEEAKDNDKTYPYTAGEARTHKLYGYGDFSVRMKPTSIVGTVSTFFVYTGEWDVVDGQKHKHDEIDIEFLGKDTTKVQFNYFVGGKGGHEYMYDLGFDASKEFHDYGFRWEKDTITWIIDGKTAYQVKKDAKNPELPSTAGRIMTNYWPAAEAGWAGKFEGATADTVDYEWIKTSATGSYCDGEEPAPEPVEFDWASVAETDLTFSTGDTETYHITKEDKVTTVTYEKAKGWVNLGAGIADAAKPNTAVNFTLKNNSAAATSVRVDVQGTTKVGNSDCLNTSAYAKGHSEMYTNMEWGGSEFKLGGNEELAVTVNYDPTGEKGLPKSLLFYFDSMQADEKVHEGGSVSISKVRFANPSGEAPVYPVDPVVSEPIVSEPTVSEPQESAEPQEYVPMEGALDFTFTATDLYTITPANQATKSLDVAYSKILGNTYATISSSAPAIPSAATEFGVSLVNNGTAAAKIRVDIQGTTRVGNTAAINTSASAAGHTDVWTDSEWGGSSITIAPKEEARFVVSFDQTTERGAATCVIFFIDSFQGDTTERSGNITLRDFTFNAAQPEVPEQSVEPVQSVEPEQSAEPQGYVPMEGALDFEFNGNPAYTVTPSGESSKSFDVSYLNLAGNTYANISSSSPAIPSTATKFAVSLTNNGDSNAKIRVDIQGTTRVGNTAAINTSASAAGHTDVWTDSEWGGSSITVIPGETARFVVSFDQATERGAATCVIIFIDSFQGDTTERSGNINLRDFIFE